MGFSALSGWETAVTSPRQLSGPAWWKDVSQFGADGLARNGRDLGELLPNRYSALTWRLRRMATLCHQDIKLDWKCRRHRTKQNIAWQAPCVLFWAKTSRSPRWLQFSSNCVVKCGFELLILHPWPSKCWDYRAGLTCPALLLLYRKSLLYSVSSIKIQKKNGAHTSFT